MRKFPSALKQSSILTSAHTALSANIRKVSGVINKVLRDDDAMLPKLGLPLGDDKHRRVAYFAKLRNGDGFGRYPSKAKKTVGGKTRSERKAAANERLIQVVQEQQAYAKRARELGLIGMRSVEPAKVAHLLKQHDEAEAVTKKTRKTTKPIVETA